MALAAVTGIVAAAPAEHRSQEAVDPILREAVDLYTGVAGKVDDPRAHQLLEQAAATGDALSRMWLARCHSRGRMLFDRDQARAREIAGEVIDEVRRLARNDVGEAAFLMGTAHAEGLGVEAEPGLALAWYARAAHMENVLAYHNLGNLYRAGDTVPTAPEIAAYWYRQAALRGDALTAFMLGQLYERGEGVSRDSEAARRWYRRGAERGNRQAREALERLDDASDSGNGPE